MKKLTNRDILILSIFTLVTVIAWITFEVYHAATTSNVTPVQKELLTPLNPVFDEEVLRSL